MPAKLQPPAHPPRGAIQRQPGIAARQGVPPPPTRFGPAAAQAKLHQQQPVARPVPAGAATRSMVVQKFPFTIASRQVPTRDKLAARFNSPNIELYRDAERVGYLKIKRDGDTWGLKDILVDGSMRGRDIGTVLVYLFALVAHSNGAKKLEVLMPNGSGLYARSGFVVTPGHTPHHPPSIAGDPATVCAKARIHAVAAFDITKGEPPRSPPNDWIESPAPSWNNRFGDPRIGDADLGGSTLLAVVGGPSRGARPSSRNLVLIRWERAIFRCLPAIPRPSPGAWPRRTRGLRAPARRCGSFP